MCLGAWKCVGMGVALVMMLSPVAFAGEVDIQLGEIRSLLRDMSPNEERRIEHIQPQRLQRKRVDLHQIILDASRSVNIEPALLATLIKVESGFDPAAVSSAGAAGLTQLMPDTASQLGISNVWDPRENVYGGARWLAMLLQDHHGNVLAALASYNAGSSVISLAWSHWPEETRNYLEKFVRLYPQVAQDWRRYTPHYIYSRS